MKEYLLEAIAGGKGSITLRLSEVHGSTRQIIGERTVVESDLTCFSTDLHANSWTSPSRLLELGTQLSRWFDGPERWLARVRRGSGFALHVAGERQLRRLPWELLAGSGTFLARSPYELYGPVAHSRRDDRDVAPQNRPLRVLFMACAPEGIMPVLDFEQEEGRILATTQAHDRPIDLLVEESGTIEGLEHVIEGVPAGHFDVCHLTGHAQTKEGEPCFLMEDEFGGRSDVTADRLARAFQGRWPRLIFVSGCSTGQSAIDVLSMCERLVSAGAPAVLGWALAVDDFAAMDAAAVLYQHLATGADLADSVARARQALCEKDSPFWHLLRLHGDATRMTALVTPPRTRGREVLPIRQAQVEFLHARRRSGATVKVCSRSDFVGRRRVLQRCLAALKAPAEDPRSVEGVLLHGMGGLGKSSLAARLCERLGEFRRVVHCGRLDEVTALRVFTDELHDVDLTALHAASSSLERRFSQLLAGALRTIPVVIVLDDFEANLDVLGSTSQPEALEVVRALLMAIQRSGSRSRVIVTSRYTFALAPDVRLRHEGVESLAGAELAKKLARLPEFARLGARPALLSRAAQLAGGNPRLLEQLNRILADTKDEQVGIIDALEAGARSLRDELRLVHLLEAETTNFRRFLACAATFDIPVSRASVLAVAAHLNLQMEELERHLDRAIVLGLIERGTHPATHEPRHFVSTLLRRQLERALSDGERSAAARNATQHLYGMPWRKEFDPAVALELHRLALKSEQRDMAAEVAADLVSRWTILCRFGEARSLAEDALRDASEPRVEIGLADVEQVLGLMGQAQLRLERVLQERSLPAKLRAEALHGLAMIAELQGDPERVWTLGEELDALSAGCNEPEVESAALHVRARLHAAGNRADEALTLYAKALELQRQVADTQSQAAIMNDLAALHERVGRPDEALNLWQRALDLFDSLGDERGVAAVLHNMAGVHEARGDLDDALSLWNRSLEIEERIGHESGKASTWQEMARAVADGGDLARALPLWDRAMEVLRRIGDTQGLSTALHNIAWALLENGDPHQAIARWRESLTLDRHRARPRTLKLTALGQALLQSGASTEALAHLQEALVIEERQGDRDRIGWLLDGIAQARAGLDQWPEAWSTWERALDYAQEMTTRAMISASMANGASRTGDVGRARDLVSHVVCSLVQQRALGSLVRVLTRLGDGSLGARVTAQGVWVALMANEQRRTRAAAAVLVSQIGPEQPLAALVAAATGARQLLERCANAQRIPLDKRQVWLEHEGLVDRSRTIPAARGALEAFIGDAWLFDRDTITPQPDRDISTEPGGT